MNSLRVRMLDQGHQDAVRPEIGTPGSWVGEACGAWRFLRALELTPLLQGYSQNTC